MSNLFDVSMHKNKFVKEPYTKPTLVRYGKVEKLTRGSTGSAADGMMTSQPGNMFAGALDIELDDN